MNQQKGGACIKRTLFSNLKELSIDPCPHIDQPQKYAKSEKPVTKEHILSKSTDIKRHRRQIDRQKMNQWFPCRLRNTKEQPVSGSVHLKGTSNATYLKQGTPTHDSAEDEGEAHTVSVPRGRQDRRVQLG